MKSLDSQTEACLRQSVDPAIGEYLATLTNPISRCLEVGCGSGQYRFAVVGNYIGLDITVADYTPGRPRTPNVLGDALRLPFVSDTFTLVFFAGFFHFLPSPERVLAEAARVLTPGGLVAIFDYTPATVKRLASIYATYNPPLEARPWTCAQWTQFLRQNGLSDVCVWRKTPVHPPWMRQIANLPLIRNLYRVLVDMREGAIVLIGRKPLKP